MSASTRPTDGRSAGKMGLPSPLSASAALSFCATSPSAVVLTVWPSGTGHLADVKAWLDGLGAQILHSSPVPLATPTAELLTVMALYDGEEWLESNCWYMEQPLPSGPPEAPYAGAKWKRALCFKNSRSREPHAIVLDVSTSSSSVWSAKYSIRAELARASGNPGNSCIHLTDEQHEGERGGHQEGGAHPRGRRRRQRRRRRRRRRDDFGPKFLAVTPTGHRDTRTLLL